ncbi:unnamed protein product [Darwinula stevensoni]|uniref:Uncharacterized protein n=1 Tax=Darwinula stevensoni TaxID=69355 RepID=A0A7R8X4Z7_9CRUS|nr:unnamed protein product [Darwinula stevensoni]CAG0884252.1 unnamed protein product [Darwinula stevensoni]
MKNLIEELVRNLSLTLVGVFVVTLVLVGDIKVSLWVFSCILFTLIGIAGGMRFTGLTIELMTSILLILSVGLAVDYSTHIAHKFMIIWFSVIYGLYHGLVYLPVMLSWFGPQPFADTLSSTDTGLAKNVLDPGLEKAPGKPGVKKTDSSSFKSVAWKKSRREYPIRNDPGCIAKEKTKGMKSPPPRSDARESCIGTSYRPSVG